jgi:hypothetical protein
MELGGGAVYNWTSKMYCVVNASQQIIVNSVAPDEVSEYDWLLSNVAQADRQITNAGTEISGRWT